jgi:hypothetical protein
MTAVNIPAARFARALPTVSPKQEGAGNAGCLLHPRSRVQEMEVEAHTSIQVQPEHSGIPRAMVLRLMPRSPRRRIPLASVIGELTASRTRSGELRLRRLDASHGRQDHTVLPYASASFVCRAADRSRAKARPAIPISAAGAAASTAFRPTSVTIAIRPSWRAGTGGVVGLIWGWREEVYFCRQDWTGQITLIGLEKFVSPRIALQDPLAIGHSRSPGGSARQAHPSKLTRVRSSACRRCQAIGNGPRTAKRLSPVRRSNRFEFRVTHGDNSA